MREDWLSEIYQRIKAARNEHLSQALSLLRKKATHDPEIAEAIGLLLLWAPDQEQKEQKTTNNP